MVRERAALHRGNDSSANVHDHGDTQIVSDWERGTFWAGVILGVSFALMGVIGGQLGW